VEPAVKAIGAQERRFQSKYKEEDAVRWQAKQRNLAEQLERSLPWQVARAVKSAVREYGNDTAALLDRIYKTPPMLKAAPREYLRLEAAELPAPEEAPVSLSPLPVLSKTKVKKLQETVKQRMEQKRRKRTLAASRLRPLSDECHDHRRSLLRSRSGWIDRGLEARSWTSISSGS
jgi:hypothetical protein